MDDSTDFNQRSRSSLEKDPKIRSDILKMRIIWFVLLGAQFLLLYWSYIIHKKFSLSEAPLPEKTLFRPVAVMALFDLLIAHFLPKLMINTAKRRLESKKISGSMTGAFYSSFVLGSVTVSAISVFGAVLAVTSAPVNEFASFFFVSIIGVLVRFPTVERIEKAFQD